MINAKNIGGFRTSKWVTKEAMIILAIEKPLLSRTVAWIFLRRSKKASVGKLQFTWETVKQTATFGDANFGETITAWSCLLNDSEFTCLEHVIGSPSARSCRKERLLIGGQTARRHLNPDATHEGRLTCVDTYWMPLAWTCLFYTSDAADEEDRVGLVGAWLLKKLTSHNLLLSMLWF